MKKLAPIAVAALIGGCAFAGGEGPATPEVVYNLLLASTGACQDVEQLLTPAQQDEIANAASALATCLRQKGVEVAR